MRLTSGEFRRSYMLGGDVVRRGRAMPSEQQKPHDPAILIWVPVGETPTTHAFAASGASTFSFLPDAVIHAQKDAAHRPEKPWISPSSVLFGPDKIRVLYATLTAKEPSKKADQPSRRKAPRQKRPADVIGNAVHVMRI